MKNLACSLFFLASLLPVDPPSAERAGRGRGVDNIPGGEFDFTITVAHARRRPKHKDTKKL